MKLALRNAIAEWLIEAIESNLAAKRVDALLEFIRRADPAGTAALDEDPRRLLHESGLFVAGAGGTCLRADLAGDLPALRARAERFEAALRGIRAAEFPLEPRPRAVAAAAVLFEHRLFFEVHELLEPPWREAEGDEREILQGLIQVAVGFHHHENGNLRGALSLLADGNAKIMRFAHLPEAFGIDLSALCRDVEAFATALRHAAAGDRAVALPPHPKWRSPACPA